MVSRASHYTSKKRHSQREFPFTRPAKAPDDSLWVGEAMDVCRGLAAATLNGTWSLAAFVAATGLAPAEAERRLRVLSQKRYLHMGSQRVDGQFAGFVWSLPA